MMSPVQAAKPVRRASPLPLPPLLDDLDVRPQLLARPSTVSSVELPSTRTTSWIQSGSVSKTCGKVLRLVHGRDDHADRRGDRADGTEIGR